MLPSWGITAVPCKDKGEVACNTGFRQAVADIVETENNFIATVELPGVDKKDLQVNLKKNGIEIAVQKQQELEDTKQGCYQKSTAGFYRYFALPDDVNTEHIDASYTNGILKLTIPKEQKKMKQIEVK